MNAAAEYKAVWISTPPRTGSMWLFNVARAILRSSGRAVLPERVPQRDEEMFDLARDQAFADSDPGRVWVFKVHQILWANLPGSRLITSRRDPRDVVVSYRRFMHTTFEDALAAAEDVVAYADAYRDYPAHVLLGVNYQDIEDRPAEVAGRIAAFLGVRLAREEIDRIVADFSRARVRQRVDESTTAVRERLDRQVPVARDEVVVEDGKVVRAYDALTGFQTGHVSDNRSGAWRSLLSAEEQRLLRERFGQWLDQEGFPSE